MEKVIKLYNYVDGVSDTPFPSKEEQVEISAFEYNASRMGGAPSINAKVKHRLCLDDLWNDNVYALFNGERFFIMNTPSSSKDNRDERYEHDLQLLSEREVLNHVFFIDAVRVGTDTQVSSGTKFQFVGSLSQFIGRLNSSLSNSGVGYSAVLDEGMDTEDKMISFEDKYVMEALQEAFRAYEMPYYFKGRVIHFGLAEDIVGDPIRYGAEDALIAVGKNNANYKVINRISGMGSEDNIPYYYPNDSDNRAEIEANGGRWITPSTNLMPSVYRESLGKERFYNALNGTYPTPEGGFYEFNNPFVQGKPLESIVDFPEIKPTIKEIKNALGYRIDMFSEFAYDTNDNDEVDKETNEYIHPYFFGKLRKMDGEFAFNLFDQANEKQAMTISMTSGVCASCNFEIGVGEETEKNIVQVDERGNLLRDEEGNVKRSGQPQDRQNDTKNYEVWVALKKDTETYKSFGVMPNAERNLRPSAGDTFVILGISLPKAYILAAEKRLDDSLIKYMFMNNDEKFSFSAKFSRIYFTERPHALQTLNENSRILLEYNGKSHPLYVDDFSYKVNAKDPLPEIEVNLTDTLTIGKNSLQNALDSVKKDILSSIGGGDFLKQGLKYFLRKDVRDTAKEVITFAKGVEIGKFKSGTSGGIFGIEKKDEKGNGGASFAEVDKLRVRMKAYFEQLEIVNVNSVGGKMIISPAGSIKVSKVEDTIDGYKCFFLAEQDGEKIENRFIVGDQGYCQLFNARKGVENKVSNKRYWRLVVGVGEDYIILSKTDADTASDIPSAGDVICQLGNRTDVDRQNALVFSAVDTFSPMITLYQGISSYTLLEKDAVSYGVDKRSGKAFFYAYGDMYVGDRPIDGQSKTYLKYTQEKGVQLKGNIHIESTVGESGDKLDKFLKDFFKEDFDNLQNQIDGKIESWFANGVPSLNNYPASEWTDDKTKNLHLGDLYYDRNTGSSYRFELAEGEYRWSEIIDTDTQEALRQAAQAQATADGKMQVFSWNGSPLSTSDSYQIGDLWVNVTYKVDEKHDYKDEILRAKDNKESGQPFSWNHWTRASGYTDDTVAKDALGKVEKAQESLNKLETTVKGMRDFTDNAFTDGIFDEGELAGFKNYLKQIDTFVEQVDKTFADVYKNPLLDGLPKTNLNTSHNSFTTATTELVNAINDAIKDKRGTTEEKALVDSKYTNFNLRYGEYSSALSVANSYIQSKLDGKIDQVQKDLGGYAFLKKVFREETSITGGLVQTTTVALGYTETAEDGSESYKIMAGTNGLYDKSKRGGGLSAWYGGGMYDFFDYYRYNEDTQDFEQIQEIPQGAMIAKSADRFDGTGYKANGKFWWDTDGNLHADPLSFFVGESTVGGLLASFQIVMQADGRHPSYIIPKVPFQKLTIADGLQIGKGKLVWDEENNALKAVGENGEVINFYSTGEVSAYGMGTSGGGGTSFDRLDSWDIYDSSKSGWVLSAFLGNDLHTRVGNLGNLKTSAKGNLVEAINEAAKDSSNKANADGTNASGNWGINITGVAFSSYKIADYTNDVDEKYLIKGTRSDKTQDRSLVDNGWELEFKGNIPKINGTYIATLDSNVASSTIADILRVRDNRDIDEKPCDNNAGVYADFKTRGTNGLDDDSVFNAVLSIRPYGKDDDFSGGYTHQLAFTESNNIWHRKASDSNTWQSWIKMASVNDNVASATKLATIHNIWGKPFDGTQDVSGDLNIGTSWITGKDEIGIIAMDESHNTFIGSGLTGENKVVIRSYKLQASNVYANWFGSEKTLTIGANNGYAIGIDLNNNIAVNNNLDVQGVLITKHNFGLYGKLSDNKQVPLIYIDNEDKTHLSYKRDVICDGNFASDGNIKGQSFTIGEAKLEWDDANNALKIVKSDGNNANFYATGEISAYGVGSGSGGGGTSFDRLDTWEAYDASKAGWVLSAYLGNDLNTRLNSTASRNDLENYYNKTQSNERFAPIVHGHKALESYGNREPQAGRTQELGGVYTYNSYTANYAPSEYMSYIGFGNGKWGCAEIGIDWCNNGMWYRSLRDVTDDWYSWRKVWDSGNFNPDNYLPLTGGLLDGELCFTGTHGICDSNGQGLLWSTNDSTIVGSPNGYIVFRGGEYNLVHRIGDTDYQVWDARNFNPTDKVDTNDYRLTNARPADGGTSMYAYAIISENPILAMPTESNEITIKNNENGSLGSNTTLSIRKALDFRWYNTHWQIGNIRGEGTDSAGFGVSYGNDNLILKIAQDGGYILDKKIITDGDASTDSYALLDYADTSKRIRIGYAGSSLTTTTYLAAYSTLDDGTTCIKDINLPTVKALMSLDQVDNTPDASKSVNYATSAGNADTVDGCHINYYGDNMNDAPYLAVFNGGSELRAAERASLSVNHATKSDSVQMTDGSADAFRNVWFNDHSTADNVSGYLMPASNTLFQYNPASGALVLQGYNSYVQVTTNSKSVSLLSSYSRGVYDDVKSKWLIAADPDNGCTFLEDGNVGIGTRTPSEKLEVNGNAKIDGNIELGTGWIDGFNSIGILNMDSDNNTVIGAAIEGKSVTVRSTNFYAPNIYATNVLHTPYNYGMMCGLSDGSEDYILYYDSNNRAHLSYGGKGVYVDGSLVASGEVTAYSDARLKDNVKLLENRGFIEPKTYVKDGKESIGFLAQDVQKLYPELVKEDNSEEKLLSLNYAQMTAVLEAQIIEQKKEIDELKNMVNELKSMINNGIK